MKNQQESKNPISTGNALELDTLNTQTSEDQTDNNESIFNLDKLFDFKPLDNYPIVAVKQDKNGTDVHFGMIGRSKVTEEFETFGELIDKLDGIGIKDWRTLLPILRGLIDVTLEEMLEAAIEEIKKGGTK